MLAHSLTRMTICTLNVSKRSFVVVSSRLDTTLTIKYLAPRMELIVKPKDYLDHYLYEHKPSNKSRVIGEGEESYGCYFSYEIQAAFGGKGGVLKLTVSQGLVDEQRYSR